MLRRTLIFAAFLFITASIYAKECTFNSGKKLFHLVGKVVNIKTEEPIEARISFKKLPHYTNIGFFNNEIDNNGEYSLPLVKGSKYAIDVQSEGFFPIQVIFDASEIGELAVFRKTFQLMPIQKGIALRLDNINFDHNNAKITESSFPMLKMIITTLNENKEISIQLDGHTSIGGSEDFNMKLSKERVNSIKQYLVANGIKRGRIKTKAYGSSHPIVNSTSIEARAKNRRVEIKILDN